MDLYSYGNSLIKRLFTVLDLTKEATTQEDFDNIKKFIEKLEVEVKGCVPYYSSTKYGDQLNSVVMKISGVKSVSDYNLRRKVVLDSIEIINRVIKELG